MKRLRLAATLLLGIATALLLAMWIRSYWTADRLEGWTPGGESLIVASKQGCVATMAFQWKGPADDWRWQLKSTEVDATDSFPAHDMSEHSSRGGFDELDYTVYVVSPPMERAGGVIMAGEAYWLRGQGVIVPYWSLALVGVALTLATRWRGRFTVRGLLILLGVVAVLLVGVKFLLTAEPVDVDEVPLP